ncbi:hypothetical protein J6590_051052 [Homalodisca vitripennis]|nr:hypothetical protein J6590_051052 [Homalodisca vitripennis]
MKLNAKFFTVYISLSSKYRYRAERQPGRNAKCSAPRVISSQSVSGDTFVEGNVLAIVQCACAIHAKRRQVQDEDQDGIGGGKRTGNHIPPVPAGWGWELRSPNLRKHLNFKLKPELVFPKDEHVSQSAVAVMMTRGRMKTKMTRLLLCFVAVWCWGVVGAGTQGAEELELLDLVDSLSRQDEIVVMEGVRIKRAGNATVEDTVGDGRGSVEDRVLDKLLGLTKTHVLDVRVPEVVRGARQLAENMREYSRHVMVTIYLHVRNIPAKTSRQLLCNRM